MGQNKWYSDFPILSYGKHEKRGIPQKVLFLFFRKKIPVEKSVPFDFPPELPGFPYKWKAPTFCKLAAEKFRTEYRSTNLYSCPRLFEGWITSSTGSYETIQRIAIYRSGSMDSVIHPSNNPALDGEVDIL